MFPPLMCPSFAIVAKSLGLFHRGIFLCSYLGINVGRMLVHAGEEDVSGGLRQSDTGGTGGRRRKTTTRQ